MTEFLETIKNDKRFYFMKKNNDLKFTRVSPAFFETYSLFLQLKNCQYCNSLTKIKKNKIQHFHSYI